MNRNFTRATGCLAVGLFVSAWAWAGPPTQTKNTDAEKVIVQIRAHVATADRNEKTYRTVERDLSGFSTEGGVLTGWFRGAELVKMTARYFGESGKTSYEYYLQKGQVFFGLKTEFSYDSLLSAKVVNQTQTRFYWNPAGRLVRVVDDKKSLDVTLPEARRIAKEFAGNVPKLMARLRTPKEKPSD